MNDDIITVPCTIALITIQYNYAEKLEFYDKILQLCINVKNLHITQF